MADQPFRGRRVAALGAATKPIPRPKLNAGKLTEAIHRAITDESMKSRATILGEKIRAEDGIGEAVAIIEQELNS